MNARPVTLTAQRAAQALGRRLVVVEAGSDGELEGAFSRIGDERAAALVGQPTVLFDDRCTQIAALAVRHKLAAIYPLREFALAGGLLSYGSNRDDQMRQLGVYAGLVLNGEKPADIPVAQPTKFDLAINLKTAKALGLDVPVQLLVLSNEVIE